jgi:hypothetical protein
MFGLEIQKYYTFGLQIERAKVLWIRNPKIIYIRINIRMSERAKLKNPKERNKLYETGKYRNR